MKLPSTAASVRQAIQEGTRRLETAGLPHARPPTNTVGGGARHEAEWLLSRMVGARPLELYLEQSPLTEETVERFLTQIEARATGIPLQYLVGEAEFCGERFAVAAGVFIPRPETETIVQAAVAAFRSRAAQVQRPLRLLDLGTGSGCIAVVLARELPTCVLVGVELSWEALCVARANVRWHGVAPRVHVIQGRWAQAIRGAFDGIVANPPYIPSAQVDRLPLDVRHEPHLSLDGGPDGMRALSQLVAQAPDLLAPGGILVLECGEGQVSALERMVRSASWADSATPLQDLAGRPRGLLITRAS